tara:strand:+ start:1491 stop:1607 length:117 start_codon:yes stop_codon:yes gene_type:complete
MYWAIAYCCYNFFFSIYETKKELTKKQHIVRFILFVEK